ncbi:MAG: helix-turn-helix domain-containing protein [Pseudomonadota bacterium]|jgi:predicted DNA-binding transcriptional regulator AlpA|nr:helix-turn-helix domain-containing protein [Pseudomonadota bacterium]
MPDLLTETDAARLIGMSVSFLRAARFRGVLGNRTPPPPHLKLGRTVRYDRRDLEAWIAARRVDPAARHRAPETASAA